MFWQASLLVVLVFAVDSLIQRWVWPQVRYALWLLVLVKLLLPPSLSFPASVTAFLFKDTPGEVTSSEPILMEPRPEPNWAEWEGMGEQLAAPPPIASSSSCFPGNLWQWGFGCWV